MKWLKFPDFKPMVVKGKDNSPLIRIIGKIHDVEEISAAESTAERAKCAALGPDDYHWVICIHNKGYRASLEFRKLYRCLPDEDAKAVGLVRVIDEEEEDYLYPADWFVAANLQPETRKALEEAPNRTDFPKYFEATPED